MGFGEGTTGSARRSTSASGLAGEFTNAGRKPFRLLRQVAIASGAAATVSVAVYGWTYEYLGNSA